MDWLWNWGGEYFGYREGDSLFTYFGHEVGRFDGEEIFGSNGGYLGEVMSDNRLITDIVTGWTHRALPHAYLVYDGNQGTVKESATLRHLNIPVCPHFSHIEVGDPVPIGL
jgi:hypothetical protein